MYFDNAATSFPKPECVYEAVNHWMRNGAAAAGRGNHRAAEEASQLMNTCRRQISRLLGVPSASQLAFTFNCTDSLNIVLQGLLKSQDRVIATTMDHNSVLRPLEALKDQRQIKVDLVDFDPLTGRLDESQFETTLRREPVRLVVLTHASNVTGQIQPLRRLIQLAHRHGALVLVDAAQTAGHLPLNMKELDADFLVTAGHKGLLGPLGTGILAIRDGLESAIQPLRFGGTGTASESLQQPDAMPSRFESGNMNLPGLAGLNAAADWIVEQSIASLHTRMSQQTLRLREEIASIRGVRLLSPNTDDTVALISFEIEDQDCRDVAMILDQSFNIQCRAGLHCAPLAHRTLGTLNRGGAIRISPGHLTFDEDITSVIEAIHQIATAS